MKRILAAIFILLFIPVISFAADNELYIGKWIHTEYLTNGVLQFIIIEIKEDHSAVTVFGKADGDDAKVPGRSFIGSWSSTSGGVTVITGHNSTKKLKLIDKNHLEEKYYGMTDVYTRIGDYILSSSDIPFDPDSILLDPCGKWSFMHDFRNEATSVLDFDYITVDLNLFEDGSAYVVIGTRNKKKTSLNYIYSDGLWLGDASSLKIKTKDYLFDAWIDESGILKLQFAENNIFSFTRVVSSKIE